MKIFKYILSTLIVLNLSFASGNLFKLIKDRKFKEAIEYLEKYNTNIDVNCIDLSSNNEKKHTLLITAIHYGQFNKDNNNNITWLNFDLVKKIINHPKIDINKTDKREKTPLYYAINAGQAEIVKLLLEKNAKINFKEDIYEAVFRAGNTGASSPEGTKVVHILLGYILSNNIKINKEDLSESLCEASNLGGKKIVEMLLKIGADVNSRDESEIPAIYSAVIRNQEKILDILIKAGADVNISLSKKLDQEGHSPIIYRATENLNLFKKLFEAGANINIKSENYGLLLHALARNSGSEEIFKIILENDLNINIDETHDNCTALFYACKHNNLRLAELLIQHGANVNFATKNNITPLHCACSNLNLEMIKLLIQNKADVNFKSENDYSPLQLACSRYWLGKDSNNVIKYLIDSGADINSKDIYSKTILISLFEDYIKSLEDGRYFNSFEELKKIFEVLLENNINIFARDNNGQSILQKLSNIKITSRASTKASPEFINKLKEQADKFINKIIETIYNNDHVNFKNYILQTGSICLKDKDGNNLLYHAIKAKNIYFIKLIWSIKPELITQENKEGKTPFDLLKESGILFQDQEILNLLKK